MFVKCGMELVVDDNKLIRGISGEDKWWLKPPLNLWILFNPTMANIQVVGDSSADRLSNLPSKIIDDYILTKLPLRDAVRTSILSKKWRDKWTTIPHLRFDEEFNMSLLGYWGPESVISFLLLHHKGPIIKFSITNSKIAYQHSIDTWLHFLLDHPIEDLALELPKPEYHNVRHKLHSSLFSFDHLTHLNLQNFNIRLPPMFKGLSKLVTLELKDVIIKFEELGTILSRCLMLEYLDMENCEDTSLWSLAIDAPNLKSFRFLGFFSSIRFASSRVEDISMCYTLNYKFSRVYDNFESMMSKIFSQLTTIKRVVFHYGSLEFLASGGVMQKLPNNLNHLTYVHIESFDYRSMNDVTAILCLIRSSPNLQSLCLMTYSEGEENECVVEYLKAQQMCDVSLSCLKYVSIFGIHGTKPEMEFMKLILLWGRALEKLEILSCFDAEHIREDAHCLMLTRHKILLQLSRFHRASPNVVFEIR